MRKFFTLVFAAMSLLGASAQYVCTTPGTVLKYSQTGEVEGNKISSTTVSTLTSVEDKDGVQILTFTEEESTETNPLGNKTSTTQVQYDAAKGTTTYIITDAESARQDVIDVIKSQIEASGQFVSESDMEELVNSIRAKGELSVTLDPSAAVDSKLPNKSLRITMGPQSMGMNLWEGKFLGTETVEVPAGKFEDCLKVSFVLNMNAGAGAQKSYITMYFAKGVGYVLQITSDKKGNELIRQELTEYTPGK